jgi:hypothetical protein
MPSLRSRVALGLVVAVAVGGAASAFAVVKGSSQGPSLKWHWPTAAGVSITPDAPMTALAERAGVSPNSIRRVVSAKSGLALVVGTDATGRTCTAEAGSTAGSFNCLSDWSDNFAMLLYSTEGGSALGVTDHLSLVGAARPDVVKVELTTEGGSQVDLSINQWRGFSYDASSAVDVPASITAFDQGGQALETEQIGATATP